MQREHYHGLVELIGFGGSFNRIRDEAAICHRDEETGKDVAKHLHDVRGTFCTKLMTEANLTDAQVAEVMGWSPDKVANIRRAYVNPVNVVLALGRRMNCVGVRKS